MKKLVAILLTLIMLLSLAACQPADGPKDPDESSGDPAQSSSNGSNDDPSSSGGNNNDDPPSGGLSQAEMESEILRRLSAISSLESLTLCGGSEITYTADGMIMAGDWWTIKDPTMGKDEFMASVQAQLTAAGFTEDYGILGRDYTVKAGPGEIGINVYYDSDSNEITLRTTNHRDEYSAEFIAAENAKLPTIIESIDIIEKLPENFSITFNTVTYKYTVCRYEGGYMVTSEELDPVSSDYRFVHYYVALPEGDGYTYYKWADTTKLYNNTFEEGTPEEIDYFMSTDTTVEEQINKLLESLSLWGRMCWDYKELPVDEDRFFFGKASPDYSISSNMTKVGEETFLGRKCEKVHSEGLWSHAYDIIYDAETGMVMKMTVAEYDDSEMVTQIEVLEYNTAPASLGKFVKPE